MTERQASDEELMRAGQEGELSAFELLFGRYERPLLSYLYRLLGSCDRAEVLTQEAFLRIFRKAARYEYPRTFSAWLYTIARNLAKNELRDTARRRELSLETELSREEGFHLRDRLTSHQKEPLAKILESEMARKLFQAINRLPEEEREVLILHRLQGLRYQEITEILGLARSMVRSRLHRALKHLQEEVQEHL